MFYLIGWATWSYTLMSFYVKLMFSCIRKLNIAVESHHVSWKIPLSIVIFHGYVALLVGGLEHFLFFHILKIIIPFDFHIFQRGSNHQADYPRVPLAFQSRSDFTSGRAIRRWTDRFGEKRRRSLGCACSRRCIHTFNIYNHWPTCIYIYIYMMYINII